MKTAHHYQSSALGNQHSIRVYSVSYEKMRRAINNRLSCMGNISKVLSSFTFFVCQNYHLYLQDLFEVHEYNYFAQVERLKDLLSTCLQMI